MNPVPVRVTACKSCNADDCESCAAATAGLMYRPNVNGDVAGVADEPGPEALAWISHVSGFAAQSSSVCRFDLVNTAWRRSSTTFVAVNVPLVSTLT